MSARVTIGVPVYNGGGSIERVLQALCAQTWRNLAIVISDNASDDDTESICRRLANADPRIRYVRQSENIGAFQNFRFVLSNAESAYFMWAAADDHWAPTFVERNVAFLEQNSEYVASISKVGFLSEHVRPVDEPGTFSLQGTFSGKLCRYLNRTGLNTRFYSVFRTDVIRASMNTDLVWAVDWLIMCETLRYGHHYELGDVLMWRSLHGQSSRNKLYQTISRFYCGRRAKILFPLVDVTRLLLSRYRAAASPAILAILIKRNLIYFLRMAWSMLCAAMSSGSHRC